MQFIDYACAEEGVIELPSPFAEQPLDSPGLPQPTQRLDQVQFPRAAYLDLVCQPPQSIEPALGCAAAG
jgi:hypothetical protein